MNWSAWYVFLGFHAINGVSALLGAPVAWSDTTLAVMQGVDIAVVVLVGPNVRAPSACTSSAPTCTTTATWSRAT